MKPGFQYKPKHLLQPWIPMKQTRPRTEAPYVTDKDTILGRSSTPVDTYVILSTEWFITDSGDVE